MPPVFMYAPIPALSMGWLVAGVRLLGLELVWGNQKMELEIRYFEGWMESIYTRPTMKRVSEESVGDC